MYSNISETNQNCLIHVFFTSLFLIVHWSMVLYSAKFYYNKKKLDVEKEFIPSLPCKGRLLFQTPSGKIFELPERLSVTTLSTGSVHGVHGGYIVTHDDQMGNLQYMCSTGQCGCERPQNRYTDGVVIPNSDEDYEESSGSESDYISDGDVASEATTGVISTISDD